MVRTLLLLVSLQFMAFSTNGQSTFLDSIINQHEAKRLVEYLASDSLKGRFTGTAEEKKAAAF